MDDESASKKVITWTHDIEHLFTAQDVSFMTGVSAGHIELNNYESVKRSAKIILSQVQAGNRLPAHSGEPPWPPERIKMFVAWIAGGCRQ